MPMWVDGADGMPYRPWGGVWVSLDSGLANVKLSEAEAGEGAAALDALLELAFKFAQTRPAAIQVTDRALGEAIVKALGDPELSVTVHPGIGAVREVIERMAASTNGAPHPAALEVRGVTVERMRAFAVAARDFYAAAPWRHLSDEDLIHVEVPRVGAEFRHLTVLGRGGQTFGLGFFASPQDLDALNALLLTGRHDETEALLRKFDDEPTALWQYGHALWAFRRDGDSPASRRRLRAAVRVNRHVPGYLTGDSEWTAPSPTSYAMGSREEAVITVEELGEAWTATPGALDWLAAHAPAGKRRKRRRR
jgi:hypothetical protein